MRKSPTGNRGLDEITGGGFPSGKPTLVRGGAGCGKHLLSVEFLVHGATTYDEPGVFMTFGEVGNEITQNVASLGFDLEELVADRVIALDQCEAEHSPTRRILVVKYRASASTDFSIIVSDLRCHESAA